MGKETLKNFYRINMGITKCYLLKAKVGYLLIDTAYSHLYDKFLEKLKDLHINVNEIKYILLTHHHDDHAGFAQRLKEETGAKLILHQAGIEFLEKGWHDREIYPANFLLKILLSLFALLKGGHKYPPVKVDENDIVLAGDDFELLKSIGIKGRIFHTPGHSRDSISVVLDDGSVFIGDAAMNFLKFCLQGKKPIFIWDREKVFESWKRLKEAGAETIYPAHGNPFPATKLKC